MRSEYIFGINVKKKKKYLNWDSTLLVLHAQPRTITDEVEQRICLTFFHIFLPRWKGRLLVYRIFSLIFVALNETDFRKIHLEHVSIFELQQRAEVYGNEIFCIPMQLLFCFFFFVSSKYKHLLVQGNERKELFLGKFHDTNETHLMRWYHKICVHFKETDLPFTVNQIDCIKRSGLE